MFNVLKFFLVENKYAAYEQRIGNVPTDALYKQMNVLEKVTDNALKVTRYTGYISVVRSKNI